MMSSYDRVAAEYYDAKLHPTCHNLRVGSEFGLNAILNELTAASAPCLELGAGASLAEHVMFSDATVVCIDLNPGMLAHSTTGLLAVADAFRLPCRDAVFDGVFGSLIDPFNVPALYTEVRRVLRPGGRFAFTVPDVTWVRHNQATDRLPPHSAGITLQTGDTVVLASYVWPYAEQQHLLNEAGFRHVRRIDVPLGVISPVELSRRFLGDDGKPAFERLVSVYEAA
jgi:SAM-dependent methyltransferase